MTGAARCDGFIDAERAAAQVPEAEHLELVVQRVDAEQGGAPYAPLPPGPLFATLSRGARELVAGGARAALETLSVEHRELSWGGWGGAPFKIACAELCATLEEGGKLCLGQTLARTAEEAERPLEALRTALIAFSEQAAATSEPPEPSPAPRLHLRMEGDYLVLRDFASAGPRASVKRYGALGTIVLAMAAVAWIVFARELQGPRVLASVLGTLAVAIVFSLGAFALFEIARFSAKYTAKHAPLLWIHDDRVVLFPWVSRSGAIDMQPEGQLGAAVRILDLNAVEASQGERGTSIVVHTAHGPAHLLDTEDAELERALAEALTQRMLAASAPSNKKLKLAQAA